MRSANTVKIAVSPWRGKATLGDGWASFFGQSGDNAPHQHLAVQMVIACDTFASVQLADQEIITSPVVLIAPNVEHQLLPGEVLLIYLDPESRLGSVLAQRCAAGVLALDGAVRDYLVEASGRENNHALIHAIANHFGVEVRDSGTDAPKDRVERLLADLKHRRELPQSLSQLATEASLSSSRLRHRIAQIVGMPYRPYLRWLRLQRALKLTIAGNSLTDAAHAAGFADAAHLARTMRRHFGITLSQVLEAFRR